MHPCRAISQNDAPNISRTYLLCELPPSLPNLGHLWPHFARNWADAGQLMPSFGQSLATLASIGQLFSTSCQTWARFGLALPNMAQHRADLADFSAPPTYVVRMPLCQKTLRHLATSCPTQVPCLCVWSELPPFCPNPAMMATFGSISADASQLSPNFAPRLDPLASAGQITSCLTRGQKACLRAVDMRWAVSRTFRTHGRRRRRWPMLVDFGPKLGSRRNCPTIVGYCVSATVGSSRLLGITFGNARRATFTFG